MGLLRRAAERLQIQVQTYEDNLAFDDSIEQSVVEGVGLHESVHVVFDILQEIPQPFHVGSQFTVWIRRTAACRMSILYRL